MDELEYIRKQLILLEGLAFALNDAGRQKQLVSINHIRQLLNTIETKCQQSKSNS